MYLKKNYTRACLFCWMMILSNVLWAQSDELKMVFQPTLNKTPLALAASNNARLSTTMQIEVFKCYLSNIELYDGDQLVFTEENSFHLLDAEYPASLSLLLNVPAGLSYSSLRFNVGIDSLTNVSGAFGGDLDPTKGMYWTWQSGYINFKLEGRADHCPARHHRFQFHIGGYQSPFNALQKVAIALDERKDIEIEVAIDKLLDQIEFRENYRVMSPNEQSVAIAQIIPSLFSLVE